MLDASGERTGLSAREVETMRAVEDDLWWYRTLRAHVLASIEPARATFDLLDAGCGSGGMLAQLRKRFPQALLTGLDFSPRALELTEQRRTGARLVEGRVDSLPFGDGEFDVVLSLDVLVVRGVDERAALREAFRVLRPSGRLILNLPAFNFLRGSHDVAVNQVRRVTRSEVERRLRETGFALEHSTYWNMTLMPFLTAARWRSRAQARTMNVRSDLQPLWPPLNSALAALTRLELVLSRRVALPFGTSLFVVARK